MEFNLARVKDIIEKKFECEIVTPMFLGSANPKEAELRAASIKGALRFWWRAVSPFYSDIKTLKEEESKRFGDSDKFGKSILKIELKLEDLLKTQRYSPLPHKKNITFSFEGICPNQNFSVILTGTNEHMKLFELFTILGGLGKRARRGFGVIGITSVSGEIYSISKILEKILQLLNFLSPNSFKKETNRIVINKNTNLYYPYIKSIEIGNKFKSYQELLEIIGKSSHDNNSDCTGFMKDKKRFASPIYVSITKHNEFYIPIITTLNLSYKTELNCYKEAEKFKKQILKAKEVIK